MDRDDLDDRVRRAATPEPAAVERVVRAALVSGEASPAAWDDSTLPTSVRARPRAFALLASGLAGAVALSVWWCTWTPAPVDNGVFRAEAIPQAVADGVYRADAVPEVAPVGVVRVTTAHGASWIFSTTPGDDWLPRGSALVVGGGEGR
jgi:hypothetical protein